MEGLTRLVAESLARHGFDRPLDYRRLHWSRWFRCESPHSLLIVPSKPGLFAIAEEVAAFCGASEPRSRNPERSEGSPAFESTDKRMLAVLQFCEDDDMAFVLDRMFSYQNPMRARLASGRCFIRYVVIGDSVQRRSICAALNQWLISSGEKASGIGAHFATSLELTPATDSVGRTLLSATADISTDIAKANPSEQNNPLSDEQLSTGTSLDSGAGANIHRPPLFPSGF